MATSKRCTLCGDEKALGEFPRQCSRKDGRSCWCKPDIDVTGVIVSLES